MSRVWSGADEPASWPSAADDGGLIAADEDASAALCDAVRRLEQSADTSDNCWKNDCSGARRRSDNDECHTGNIVTVACCCCCCCQCRPTHGSYSHQRRDVTVVGYFFCDDPIPYRTTTPGNWVTLAQFKRLLSKRGNFRLGSAMTLISLLQPTRAA